MLTACSVPCLPKPTEQCPVAELLVDTRAQVLTLPGALPPRGILQAYTLQVRAHRHRAGKDLV